MEEVKGNVKTFLEIMQIAMSESVAHWDESNFKRAWQWAKYVEEVHRKLRNKPLLAQTLSNHVEKIQKGTVMRFPFNGLQNASENLRLALLHNPHISSAQFSLVLDLYKADFFSPASKHFEEVISDTYSMSCSKGTFLTLSSMKDQLHLRHEDCNTENTCLDACAKLLHENLVNLMEKQEGFTPEHERFVSSANKVAVVVSRHLGRSLMYNKNKMGPRMGPRCIFSTLLAESCSCDDDVIKRVESLVFCSEKGMEVILRMLLLPVQDDSLRTQKSNPLGNNKTVSDKINNHVFNWITESAKSFGTDICKRIWSSPSGLLCKISMINISFCESYLIFLYCQADTLLGIGSGTVDDERSCGASYEGIIEVFKCLTQQEHEDVSELCKQKLQLWSVDSLKSSPGISPRDENLRANLWRRMYLEICK